VPYIALAKIGGILLLAAAIFSAGYASSWKTAQVEIGRLQGSIDVANAQSARVLADATAKVNESTKTQLITAEKLQVQHDEATKVNNSLKSELANARLQYRSANKSRSGCTVPDASDTTENPGNDETGFFVDPTQLSEEFDRLIQEKAPIADQIDADRHFILQWLNSLPPEIVHE